MAAKSDKKTGNTITIKQVRSEAGRTVGVKDTLKALGLGRIGREKTIPDNVAVRGMIRKVEHLVQVFE